MKRLLLLLILSSVLAFGCWKPAPQPVVHQGSDIITYDHGSGGQVLFDIPVKIDDEVAPPQGWNTSDIITFELPNNKKVYIRPYRPPLLKKIFPSKDQPKYEVISSDPELQPMQAPSTPWWWYAIGMIGAGLVLWQVLSSLIGSITGPLKLIMRLFGR